jgi:hypothetical protein
MALAFDAFTFVGGILEAQGRPLSIGLMDRLAHCDGITRSPEPLAMQRPRLRCFMLDGSEAATAGLDAGHPATGGIRARE